MPYPARSELGQTSCLGTGTPAQRRPARAPCGAIRHASGVLADLAPLSGLAGCDTSEADHSPYTDRTLGGCPPANGGPRPGRAPRRPRTRGSSDNDRNIRTEQMRT
ncbi:hypothetical protein N9L68_04895 [bacterium]|nr:hypothetical protein [bacterium]